MARDQVLASSAGAPAIDLDGILGRLRAAFIELSLVSIVINLLALATPIFMMTVYNKVINHNALQTLDALAIGMLGLFGFEVMLRVLRGHVASRLAARLDVALGSELWRRTLELPLASLEALAGRGMVDRLRQLDHLRAFFAGQLPVLCVDLLFVGLFLAALFFLAPGLALVTAAVMPAFVALSMAAARHQTELSATAGRLGSEKVACLSEAMSQALTVKALGLEAEVGRRFEARLLDNAWVGFRSGSVAGLSASLAQALQSLTALAVVYIGARSIVAGELSTGALVAATILSGRTLAPMRQIVGSWQQFQQAFIAYRELQQASRESLPMRLAIDPTMRLAGRVRFVNVSFRYADDRPIAIENFDLDVKPGTMLAVIGPPGSGKSTLVRLLLGLEQPQSGRVTIDGHVVTQLPPAILRREIGAVPQEVQLFAGTIAQNIAAGAEDGSFGRIVAAAKFVGLHEPVQGLPLGYDTVLGERGRGLSLGQRQLVTIARALVRNPRLLVLDEATSALDGEAEAALLANLRRAASGRTIVLVTHRRSVLDVCDAAVLMENGRIVTIGSPAEVGRRLGKAGRGGAGSTREAEAGR